MVTQDCIVIFGKDKVYLQALFSYLSEKLTEVSVFIFEDESMFFSEECKRKRIRFVLSSDLYFFSNDYPVIYLCEEKNKKDSVYKYQKGEDLIKEAFSLEEKFMEKEMKREMTLTGVLTPRDFAKKSDFSSGLSLLKSQSNKTLFLSFDPFLKLYERFNVEEKKSFSSFLYDFQTGKEICISDYLIPLEENLFLFPVLTFPEDLLELNEKFFNFLFDLLRKENFIHIIIDIQNEIHFMKELVPFLQKMYVVSNKETEEEDLFRPYLSFLERIQKKERSDSYEVKIHQVILPDIKVRKSSLSYRERILFGELGDIIRKCVLDE